MHKRQSSDITPGKQMLWGEEEGLWERQGILFGHENEHEQSFTDKDVGVLHEQLLLRELTDLRNGEVSDRQKFGIWVWILDPLFNDGGAASEPFTFAACCAHAGYVPVSLIKSLIESRKGEIDRLFRPGAAQALWERAEELDEPADHCLASAMATRKPGVHHA